MTRSWNRLPVPSSSRSRRPKRATADKVLEAEEEVEAAEGSGADETFLEEEEEGDDDCRRSSMATSRTTRKLELAALLR